MPSLGKSLGLCGTRLCVRQATPTLRGDRVIFLRPSQIAAPRYLPCPSLACLKLTRLRLFPRKPGTQLRVSFPTGDFQLSLLAPDVKEQLWEWQEAQLAAKAGETGKRQGCSQSRPGTETTLSRSLATGWGTLPDPPDTALQPCPHPCRRPGPSINSIIIPTGSEKENLAVLVRPHPCA